MNSSEGRVVLFSLPGAFTPTCSSNPLPRYEELHGEFVANGVDQIVFLSVTDADTMLAYLKGIETQSVSQPVRAFEG
jgi:peroxiredoxin